LTGELLPRNYILGKEFQGLHSYYKVGSTRKHDYQITLMIYENITMSED